MDPVFEKIFVGTGVALGTAILIWAVRTIARAFGKAFAQSFTQELSAKIDTLKQDNDKVHEKLITSFTEMQQTITGIQVGQEEQSKNGACRKAESMLALKGIDALGRAYLTGETNGPVRKVMEDIREYVYDPNRQ